MADLKGDDSLSEFPNLKLPQLLFVWEKNGAKADQLEDAMVGASACAVLRWVSHLSRRTARPRCTSVHGEGDWLRGSVAR